MDMFDNKDRSHRADFADWWDKKIVEQANPGESASDEMGNLPALGSILETALEFAWREWAGEAADAAREARACADAPWHGSNLLHGLADRWSERAESWSVPTNSTDQSPD